VIGRLAGKGEEALQKLADLPGGSRTVQAFNDLRNRVDELSKRIRGIDALEQRVAKLEKEVASLRRAQKPASGQSPSRKASA
jgi:phage shock protein A